MADIIIGTQIINGEIRLKMQCNHIVDAVTLESRFIAVNIVCTLLVDNLHILE